MSSANKYADILSPIRWTDGRLELLDQRALPAEETWQAIADERQAAAAIRDMVVRGAPAIGVTAAFGVALAARRLQTQGQVGAALSQGMAAAIDELAAARPTAVNLFWALESMRPHVHEGADALEQRAIDIFYDDIERCLAIGKHGAELIEDGATVLTHCNAGALATAGYGTALGVLRGARAAGKALRVFADETRPFLQGARLTAWELARDGFDVTVIPDSAAAWLMKNGEIQCVVVGADRIAKNADVANKIGTYSVALAAKEHNIPFYVAAPWSTIDLACEDGTRIPIEERSPDEVTHAAGVRVAPGSVSARNPAFDVTPARLVSAIVTERGIMRPPWSASLADQR